MAGTPIIGEDGPRKLPVFWISWQSYRFVFCHFVNLLRLAWVPLCALLGIFVAMIVVESNATTIYLGLSLAIRAIIQVLFPALILVKWHQFVLLGPFQAKIFDAFKIGKPEIIFLAISASLCLATSYVPKVVAYFIGTAINNEIISDRIHSIEISLLSTLVILLFLFAFCRFFILLPSVAIGNPVSVAGVWQLAKGYAVPIFAILFLTSGLTLCLLYFVRYWLMWFLLSALAQFFSILALAKSPAVLLVHLALGSITTILSGIIGATALSFCYRHLTGIENAPGGDKDAKAKANP
ncbi:MAG: hypothetical protein ISR47_10350 [Rhodospirillales bacterium]|nr:hypothetical protein [Rhodospirillales bacterium]